MIDAKGKLVSPTDRSAPHVYPYGSAIGVPADEWPKPVSRPYVSRGDAAQ